MNSKPENPSWLETAILAISFVLMWVWYLARQSVYRAGGVPSSWWHLILVGVFVALLWVFVRRVKRVTQAMKDNKIGIGKPRQ